MKRRQAIQQANLFKDIQSSLTQNDYSLHLIAHFMAEDLNCARFLWKRIPRAFKQAKPENQGLINIWNVGKSLTQKEYENVYKLIDVAIASFSADIKPALEFLKTVQKELIVAQIQKAYTSIQADTAKKMLGESDPSTILKAHGFSVKGQYFVPGEKEIDSKTFEITDDRIAKISEIVQFLESQKIEAPDHKAKESSK